MPGVIETALDGHWEAVKAAILAVLETEQDGVEWYEFADASMSTANKALVVVDRVAGLQNTAYKLVMGLPTVEFGCMVRSESVEDGQATASSLAYWLVDLLLADPMLSGASRDVEIVNIQWKADAPEELGTIGPTDWVTVIVSWQVDFARP